MKSSVFCAQYNLMWVNTDPSVNLNTWNFLIEHKRHKIDHSLSLEFTPTKLQPTCKLSISVATIMCLTFEASGHNSSKYTTIIQFVWPNSITHYWQAAKYNLNAVLVPWRYGDIHLPKKFQNVSRGKYGRKKFKQKRWSMTNLVAKGQYGFMWSVGLVWITFYKLRDIGPGTDSWIQFL